MTSDERRREVAEALRGLDVSYLIDRPTCRMDTDGKRHKSEVFAECKQYVWFCSECGSPICNDLKPSFCIYCGAKVVGE